MTCSGELYLLAFNQVFGYAAAFFGIMKHPDDAFVASLGGANLARSPNNLTIKSKGRTGRRHSSIAGADGNSRLPEIEFGSEKEKRLTYQLVFQTLKCK